MEFDKEYPRRIVINSAKLIKLLKEKGDIIIEGRKVSDEIEALKEEMDKIDLEVQEIEKTVDLKDLKGEAENITNDFNEIMKRMEKHKEAIRARLHKVVPQELKDKYAEKKKEEEKLEIKRNKLALKAQKWNDKIIPLGRKLMKPYIEDEMEDYDTIRLENGEAVATIFNHLDEHRKRILGKKDMPKA